MICYEDQKVLVLAPHCDDETLGCGGIIQKFVDAGSEVHVVVFSFVMGDFHKYDPVSQQYVNYSGEKRYDEYLNVVGSMGVKSHRVLKFEDRGQVKYHLNLDAYSLREFLPLIESIVNDEFRPTVILTPAPSKNQDHRYVNELTRTLMRPYYLPATVLEYEVDGEIDFVPNLYVALNDMEARRKVTYIEGHSTQNSGPLHPTSPEKQFAKMVFRGGECGAYYAEAFRVMRVVG